MSLKFFTLFILSFFLLENQHNLVMNSPDSGSTYDQLWKDCQLEKIISKDLFNIALSGYNKIDKVQKQKIITIIDFTKPSTEKRFFVINLEQKKLIFTSWVAHGKNSGENYAKSFSNQPKSLESSLGFFATAETYYGKHGYSLRLDGLEKEINDNARKRSIVIHGATYVSQAFIKQHGRLGRSWGCPALPIDLSKEIIDSIANGSCLFIFANNKEYLNTSEFIVKEE